MIYTIIGFTLLIVITVKILIFKKEHLWFDNIMYIIGITVSDSGNEIFTIEGFILALFIVMMNQVYNKIYDKKKKQ